LRLGLHQLRLAGELAEIRAATCAFPNAKHALCLMPRASRYPRRGRRCCTSGRRGGRPCLRLAAISLTGHPDPERFVTEFSGSDRTVAEYLLVEMLDCQPPDVQDLLLRTSLLDQGQRRTGRSADRSAWLGTDPAESRRRECVRRIAGPRARVVSATTTCSRISCG